MGIYKRRITVNLVFISLLSFLQCLSACNFSVSVKQLLNMEGFHRNISYEIKFKTISIGPGPNVWPYKECVVGVYQDLPPGIYANTDELNDLRRSYRINAITKKTNVELPAELSEPSTVYIIQKTQKSKLHTWIPIHARYHKARNYGGYAINEIDVPQLFMRCPDERLDECEKPLVPATFLCSATSTERCGWKTLPFKMNTETLITWPVPVGDLLHYQSVAVVTGIVVSLGSLYLLYTLHEFKFIYMY